MQIGGRSAACQKSLAEFRRRSGERIANRFSGDMCVGKTHLGLQTCELSAVSGQ